MSAEWGRRRVFTFSSWLAECLRGSPEGEEDRGRRFAVVALANALTHPCEINASFLPQTLTHSPHYPLSSSISDPWLSLISPSIPSIHSPSEDESDSTDTDSPTGRGAGEGKQVERAGGGEGKAGGGKGEAKEGELSEYKAAMDGRISSPSIHTHTHTHSPAPFAFLAFPPISPPPLPLY